MPFRRLVGEDMLALAALTGLWLLPVLVIGIHGDFPMSDDWAYARTTETWLETGSFERPSWTWAPVITNVLIGASFAQLFGFSFETLRVSGVFMGWVGLLGSFALFREFRVPPLWSALAGVLVALNPLYLNLSYGYMTDVPFTALVVWSLFCLCRGMRTSSWPWLAAGCGLTVGAILSRQNALAVPLGLALVTLLTRWLPPLTRVLFAVAAGAAVAVLPLVWDLLLGPGDAGNMFTFGSYVTGFLRSEHLAYFTLRSLLSAFVYLGLFLAPLCLLLAPRSVQERRIALVALGASGVVLCALWSLDLSMPLTLDRIYDLGLGPIVLSGSESLSRAPRGTWWLVTAIGLMSGFHAVGRFALEVWERRGELLRRPEWLLLVLVVVIYGAALLPRWPMFDRYLLPVFPLLVALLLVSDPPSRLPGRRALLAFASAAALLGAYSVIGTRDYLEHHRARWVLLEALFEQGVTPAQIDGGSAFGGWFNYHPDWERSPGPNRLWVVDDEFVVSLRDELPGYTRIASGDYRRFLPPRVERISVHRRE